MPSIRDSVISSFFVLLVLVCSSSAQNIDLGAASTFAIIAYSTITNTGPTVITGDLGLSPGSAITGFPPGILIGTMHLADAQAASALSSATTAYTSLQNLPCSARPSSSELGGMVLYSGVYCFTSSATLDSPLVLDAQGNANAKFVFVIGSSFITSTGASIQLINSASAANVYFVVGSSATLSTGTVSDGTIIAYSSITFNTGATLMGRAFALNGAVTLDSNTITNSTFASPIVSSTASSSSSSSVPSSTASSSSSSSPSSSTASSSSSSSSSSVSSSTASSSSSSSSLLSSSSSSLSSSSSSSSAPSSPATVKGDPQFAGLRGQLYQVHGIDGAVYNIISDSNTQINSRFVFLSSGECPEMEKVNCWTHPGSYIGEMSFQQVVNGLLHKLVVISGPADAGFRLVQCDNLTLGVGNKVVYGSLTIDFASSHVVLVSTEQYSLRLSNSDMFINQAVESKVPLAQLRSHGLLGQTHSSRTYQNALKYIEGEVDDYVVADDDIFGSNFLYNRFYPDRIMSNV